MLMDWFAFASNLLLKIPFEKVLFPRRDTAKELQEFAAGLGKESPTPPSIQTAKEPQAVSEAPVSQPPLAEVSMDTIATACIPCAIGHFSTSTGLLNEAVRFKAEGITSNEVIDRIGKSLEEQNALERKDLTAETIQSLPKWEREIAEEALQRSRGLRHQLETITSIEELEQIAADTQGYYRTLNRKWWKQRLGQPSEPGGTRILPVVSDEEREEIKQRAKKKIEEVLG